MATDSVDLTVTVKKTYKSVEAWVWHWILTYLGGWDVNILSGTCTLTESTFRPSRRRTTLTT
jgi:hypothetical protein